MTFPACFVSHGAPPLALDRVKGRDLQRLGEQLGRPTAILVVSAHWEEGLSLGTQRSRELLYDFGGFAPALFQVRYPAPPAPELAAQIGRLLRAAAAAADDASGELVPRELDRPWDHGVWVPLLHMFPAADVPLLQLSLPSQLPPERLLELGRRLAPLREEGVLILGSGSLTHNLSRLDWSDRSCPPPWALSFEAWVRETLAREGPAGLAAYRQAPFSVEAHPTPEHFLPLLVAAGAAAGEPHQVALAGFDYGSLSRTAFRFGAQG